MDLDENRILRRLKRGDTQALAQVIESCSAYVYAIAKNILQPPLQSEDCEEVVSDVFLRLWEKADTVEPGKLRGWLAAVTRNCARDRLRGLRLALPLEEDAIDCPCVGPEEDALRRELQALTREAVEALPEPDRSIFLRYYFFFQKTPAIAEALDMQPAAVRARLSRGRERLKRTLTERGIDYEAANH